MARKQIQINFVDNSSVGNSQSMGQWKDPNDKSYMKDKIEYYTDLAKLAESGKITTIFFTDSYGNPETYEKSASSIFIGGGHVGHMDPLMVAGPMAMATTTVGITCTCTSSYIPPYIVARTFSTLDHLTKGRIGWNVVTSFNSASVDAMGLDKAIPHDERYERAHEFMDILYDLWEGSWEDGAKIFDKERNMAYDPKKVHKIKHEGKFYKMNAYSHVHPSPQRTPVIFQAGASKAGIEFAAKHVEGLFLQGNTTAHVKKQVKAVREEANRIGRDGSQIKFFLAFQPTLGRTHEEAVAKHKKAEGFAISEGGIATVSSFVGVDLSKYPLDEPFDFQGEKTDTAIYGWIDLLKGSIQNESIGPWTPRKMGQMMGMGLGDNSPVGTAAEVADMMEKFMDEADIDGFNIMQYVASESFKDVVELLVPELQKRGRYWTEYAAPGGTLRENMLGIKGQSKLVDTHPAHQKAWNVRETNHPTVWDMRENGVEIEAAKANRVNGSH